MRSLKVVTVVNSVVKDIVEKDVAGLLLGQERKEKVGPGIFLCGNKCDELRTLH